MTHADDAVAQWLDKPAASQPSASKQWESFNMNDYVRVKLLPRGKELHRKSWEALWAGYGNPPSWEYRPPTEDADGWSEWQLWALMQEFGEHISIGANPPFETTIEFVRSSNN